MSSPTERGPTLLAAARGAARAALHAFGLEGQGGRVLLATAVLAWLLSGVYKVQPDEQGVVLRFGRWSDTVEPGLHYHLPFPVDRVLLPKVTQVNQLTIGSGDTAPAAGGLPRTERSTQMVTGDENIVVAEYVVFWRIKDAGRYLFSVHEPDAALRMAAESAMHAVIGRYPIQAALSDKRQEIAEQARQNLQSILDDYQAGILVTRVQLQRVDPPTAVIDAFNDVQRARADQERARNEAEAYANDVLPRARGEADRINQDAEAYRSQVVNLARGQIQEFLSVYEIYRNARDVTSWRMYLDSMDQLLKKSSKVIIDSSGRGLSGVVPYMPLSEGKGGAAATPPAGGK